MRKLASALLLVALTACGSAATGTDSTGASTPAASPSAAAPSAAPSTDASMPAPSIGGELTAPSGPANGDSAAVDRKGSEHLAANLNVAPEKLTLVSKEQTEWSDSSLGCPDPAALYLQVITPGWKLTYNDGTRDYDVRSNQDGSQVVWCEGGTPKALPQP